MRSNSYKMFYQLLRYTTFIVPLILSLRTNASFTDTTLKVLSAAEFIQIVRTYHPVAKQANLIPDKAKAELLLAYGGWDPNLYSVYANKTYNGSNYYSYFENKIAVPTWYGVELTAGYDFVYGQKVNSENVLPQNGLGSLGVSIPLLKNMLMDKQRASLKQAQIFREASEQQRLVILNDLLFNALKTYYDWSYSYNEYLIYSETVRIATIRFNATLQGVIYGERAAMDTTEALTQLQGRQFQLNEAKLRFLNNGILINNYLWLDNDTPRPIDTTLIPLGLTSDFTQYQIQLGYMEDMAAELQRKHPLLLSYDFRLQQLEVERKLKVEGLKPTLNMKYNLLSEQFDFRSAESPVFNNNYKFGVSFSMPLTFMQGRGLLKITKLEIQNTQLAMDYKRQELLNKMRSTFNELVTIQNQTILYEQTLVGFRTLFDAEITRLNNGESSLFLVNARENKFIESRLKLVELQAKYFKTEAELKWSVGNMNQ